jgi:hypothetical protein
MAGSNIFGTRLLFECVGQFASRLFQGLGIGFESLQVISPDPRSGKWAASPVAGLEQLHQVFAGTRFDRSR